MVWNLHTGFISSQHHVVFDDKFETVYHDGKSSEELDCICDKLFVSSRECYAKEEYDEDGILIYKPPPLDEVWLTEGEHHNRRTELDRQRQRNQKRERGVASKAMPENLKQTRRDDDSMPPF